MDWYDYRHASRQLLGEEVIQRKLIYLDTKYWIFLRDVLMDRPQKAIHNEIFARLYDLVRRGKCLCPFSYPIFCELHKQSDPKTRKMTAQVIDLFSGSVCLQNPDALTRGEILGFFRKYNPHYSVKIPRRVIVWTKAGFCLGEPIPTNPAVSPDVELLVQKVMEDHSLSMTLEELVDAFHATGKPFPMPPPQHEKLNANKAGLAGAKDFRDAYLQEVAFTIDSNGKAIHDVFVHLFLEEYGHKPKEPFQDDAPGIQQAKSLLYSGFATDKLPLDLPCFHIESAIHAAIRIDKTRKYKANDLLDFEHAVMAVPYYDYFFTEASLAHFVTHPPLTFDKLYGATVFSKEEEILIALQEMAD